MVFSAPLFLLAHWRNRFVAAQEASDGSISGFLSGREKERTRLGKRVLGIEKAENGFD